MDDLKELWLVESSADSWDAMLTIASDIERVVQTAALLVVMLVVAREARTAASMAAMMAAESALV